MINLKALRENPGEFAAALKKKGFLLDPAEILQLETAYKALLQKSEQLRHTQNLANTKVAQTQDQSAKIQYLAELKKVSTTLKSLTNQLTQTKKTLEKKLLDIPNPPDNDVPAGGEDDSVVLRKSGQIPQFEFTPLNHVELATKLGLLDLNRGTKSSGARFYYLLNSAVKLEFALINFILAKLKDFTPVIGPTLVRAEALFATGFFPAEREQIYSVNPTSQENPNGDDLFLIGTSEVSLAMLHANEILAAADLPKRYLGFSTCYRREAGSYGRDTKGIFRVHQFDKLEMFSYVQPEKSATEHEFLLNCQEEILQALELPYRVVKIAAGDLGAPAAKKYDCEVYLPSEKKYRELTSCSNCTDFQAHRAKIRFQENSKKALVHTLNGTAAAISRTLIAIFENYQNPDGSLTVPTVLQKYLGEKVIS